MLCYMGTHVAPASSDRRRTPRVRLEMLFTQYIRDQPFRSLAMNVSESGLSARRLVEPVTHRAEVVGLEFELPGTNEVIWAKAAFQFEQADRDFHHAGIRFLAMASRHERLVRDFVREKDLRSFALWRYWRSGPGNATKDAPR
jgi:hypothetical protein